MHVLNFFLCLFSYHLNSNDAKPSSQTEESSQKESNEKDIVARDDSNEINNKEVE
jgi:hypothetical protein